MFVCSVRNVSNNHATMQTWHSPKDTTEMKIKWEGPDALTALHTERITGTCSELETIILTAWRRMLCTANMNMPSTVSLDCWNVVSHRDTIDWRVPDARRCHHAMLFVTGSLNRHLCKVTLLSLDASFRIRCRNVVAHTGPICGQILSTR